MGVKISGVYKGKKRIEITHEPSGAVIVTDAPVDNNGEGSSFSPTDLCAASLGSCIVTILAIKAEQIGIQDFQGAYFSVEKMMNIDPRRIGVIQIEVHLPQALSERERTVLETVGKACPVHLSLHSEVKEEVSFHYDV